MHQKLRIMAMIIPPNIVFLILYTALLSFSYQEYKHPSDNYQRSLILAICWAISGVVTFCWLVVTLAIFLSSNAIATSSLLSQVLIASLLLFLSFRLSVYFKKR